MSRLRARDIPGRLGQAASRPAIVAAALLALCMLLHQAALSAGWRFDDGPLLYFVTKFSPWEYFSSPDAMRQQSWASLTPWNALFGSGWPGALGILAAVLALLVAAFRPRENDGQEVAGAGR